LELFTVGKSWIKSWVVLVFWNKVLVAIDTPCSQSSSSSPVSYQFISTASFHNFLTHCS
jgi:hypothetical protein